MDETNLTVRENRIPFELSLQPNELTRKTIALAEEGKELNGPYKTMEDLRASLDAWCFYITSSSDIVKHSLSTLRVVTASFSNKELFLINFNSSFVAIFSINDFSKI